MAKVIKDAGIRRANRSTAYHHLTGPIGQRSTKKGPLFLDSGLRVLHVWRSANEQPTGEAERLAGPRARSLEIPPVKC